MSAESFVQVLDADADRTSWLAARQSGIGSSDIAGVLGQSSWQSPYSIWWSKVGPVEDEQPSEQVQWGIRLEPIICDAWSDQTGIATTRVGLCRNLDRPWQMATPDRITADGGVLETKNVNSFNGDEWDSDTIPLKYLLQVTQQMDVLGRDHGYVAALIGGAELRTFEVTPDPEIVAIIRERGAEFWQLVLSQTAPPTDGHDATTAAIKKRWMTPDDPEAIVTLGPEWLDHLDRREVLKLDIKNATAASVAIDNGLRDAMGAATHAVCMGALIAKWQPRKDGVRVLNVIDSAKRKEFTA